jgi:hypothetical protein
MFNHNIFANVFFNIMFEMRFYLENIMNLNFICIYFDICLILGDIDILFDLY